MSFIRPNAPVIVQGMTGHQGMTHTARMLKQKMLLVLKLLLFLCHHVSLNQLW